MPSIANITSLGFGTWGSLSDIATNGFDIAEGWPASPSDGQFVERGGQLYRWNAATPAWLLADKANANKDADGNKVINLGTPTDADDSANLGTVEDLMVRHWLID